MLYHFICQQCSKAFENRRPNKKFCSTECYHKSKDVQVPKICEICSKNFIVPYRRRKQRTCGAKCGAELAALSNRVERITKCCLQCQKQFEVIPSAVSKYCSTECFYKHEYGRESATVIRVCRNCSSEFEVPFIKRDRAFCSRECVITGDFNPSKDSNVVEKALKTRRENIESGAKQPVWLGKTHTDESKEKISQARLAAVEAGIPNGMLGRNHTEESKEKMSKTKSQMIVEGRFNPLKGYHITGWHESSKNRRKHFYRSSWERDVMIWLDCNNDVVSWDSENARIPYYYENNKRWYVPDFIVQYTDKKVMYEVKPKEFLGALKTRLKESAAREWCSYNGVDSFEYLTKEVLLEKGILKPHAPIAS